ncbi:MAG: TonB-dependent hemoglobin/transferrin/lactoferrin family receptor [Proteobacteria bacterium]|nr:TonB-dependent hemoglobin/transferrin/lactoferrin family receptor [Pseudomonadota bacterium]
MRLGTFSCALLCGTALFSVAHSARAEEPVALDLITVTVLKMKQALSNVAGSVSVATKTEAGQHGANSVSDVLTPLPSVDISQNADDPATAINVRGLQDFGRVAVTIDGARQNFQRTGHNADGMFYFEPEQMQQVTVTRGPISNVYGSGAIGGVVSFETMDSLSFLRDGETIALAERLRYTDNGDAWLSSTTGAVRFGEYGGFLGNFVYRNSDNYKDGDGDTVANSGRELKAGLAKLTLTPNADTRFDFSYLVNNNDFSTTSYHSVVKAETLSGKFQWDPADNDLINLTIGTYWTGTNHDQEYLTAVYWPVYDPTAPGQHRVFDISTTGIDVYNTSVFETGTVKHTVTYGVDAFRDKVEVVDPVGTASLYTPSGKRSAAGAFVQDQIDLSSWLQFIVAGRYDTYQLSSEAAESDGSHFSPKATVVLKPFEGSSLSGLHFYGTYAEGYRAPSITETLISGTHPGSFSFDFLPNPDLKPEVARTVEAGITGDFSNVIAADDNLKLRGNIFKNRIKDYIDATFDMTTWPMSYQYINIGKAELWGLEGEISYDAGWIFASVAASIIRGENMSTNDPLVTVPADKVVSTLGFRFLEEKAVLGARWLAVAEQDSVAGMVDVQGSPYPTSDAYNVVDLFATYRVNESVNVALNVNNVFDEDYRRYLDGSDSPGRSVMLTLEARLGYGAPELGK